MTDEQLDRYGVTREQWDAMESDRMSGGPLGASPNGGAGGEWPWRPVMRAMMRRIEAMELEQSRLKDQMFVQGQAYQSLKKELSE